MTDPLEPFTFDSGVRTRNRVALAALTNLQSHDDGSLSPGELRFLERRAEGGFGIVTTCAAHVARDGQGWKGELGIYDDALLPGLSRLARAVGDHGALPLVQLFHGGHRADPALIGEQPFTASELLDRPGAARAATEEDLVRVVRQFADAAARAERAGMSGVEIHGAHGYLLCQFLSSVENRRTDAWGGSFEGRSRLVREVTRAVRSRVSRSFVVGVRISPEDFGNARGLDLDESLELARALSADGANYIHLSLWTAARNSTKRPDVHPLTEFRRVVPPRVALIVAGKIWTSEEARALLALGADLVALGRAAIANPEWPARIQDPMWQPRRPPLTEDELARAALSPPFVAYMRQWKGFVAGDPPAGAAE